MLAGVVFTGFASGAQPTLIENATLITINPDDALPFQGYLAFDSQGLITEVGKGKYTGNLDPESIRIDASGMILIPGLVSGHGLTRISEVLSVSCQLSAWSGGQEIPPCQLSAVRTPIQIRSVNQSSVCHLPFMTR